MPKKIITPEDSDFFAESEKQKSVFDDFTLQERNLFQSLLSSALKIKGVDSEAKQIREIVPIEKWLESEYYLGPDGCRIYDFWKQFIVDIFNSPTYINEIIIDGSIGCLKENTRVPTSIGNLTLKDLDLKWKQGERFQVLSEEGFKDVLAVYDNGESETVRIKTKQGREVEGTPNHKFRVVELNEETQRPEIKWKRFDELKEGDIFTMTRKETPFGSNSIGKDYAYLLGAMSGDGGICLSSRKNKEDKERVIPWILVDPKESNSDYIRETFKKEFVSSYSTISRLTEKHQWQEYIRGPINRGKCEYLLSEGFGTCSGDKRVPNFIFSLNKIEVGSYLRGLFDTDGTIGKDNLKEDGRGNYSIELTLKNKEMIYDVSFLLSMFGINYKITDKKFNQRSSVTGELFYATRLIIVGKDSYRLFHKHIGFNLSYKKDRLEGYVSLPVHRNERINVPYGVEELKIVLDYKSINNRSKVKSLFGWLWQPNVTYETLKKLNELFPEQISNSSYLTWILKHDCFFDAVVSVEKSFCYCRDLTVRESHTYSFQNFQGKNTGKSSVSDFIVLRKLYELSCYTNIQAKFNLMRSKLIMFFYFSVTKSQAEITGYGSLKNLVDSIEYFEKEFPRNKRFDKWLLWPQENIAIMYGSNSDHCIGLSLLLSVMDEANFMGREGDFERSSNGQLSKASNLYEKTRQRAQSRFSPNGFDQSFSLLVSSSTHESSFTEERKRKSLGKSNILSVTARLWDVKPKDYPKPKFWVCVGNHLIDPFICDTISDLNQFLQSCQVSSLPLEADLNWQVENNPDVAPYRSLFQHIPGDFRDRFESNIVSSLQNIAGVSVAPIGKLFTARPILVKAYQHGESLNLEHPFTKSEIVISTHDDVRLEHFWRQDFEFKNISAPRYIHIDQSFGSSDNNGDCGGISQVYIDRFEEKNGLLKPVFCVDYMLQINPPRLPQKLSISKVRDFVFWLQDNKNINFGFISYDGAGSAESLQTISERGIPCKLLSVDRSDDAYTSLVNIIFEERLYSYFYEPFENNFLNLIHDRANRKVDHPKSCFVADTKIKLLDGTYPTIKELSDRTLEDPNYEFWVYSSLPDGTPVPGKARRARLTSLNREIVEVKLDNGETIRCTPDHRFLLRNGEYREAEFLTTGDSLMPLYWAFKSRLKKRECEKEDGYERIKNNKTGQWCLTHSWVSRFFDFGVVWKSGNVIHHVDYNKKNNIPENLQLLTNSEHMKIHALSEAIAKMKISLKKYFEENPSSAKERRKGYVPQHLIDFLKTEEGINQSGKKIEKVNEVYWKSEEGVLKRNQIRKELTEKGYTEVLEKNNLKFEHTQKEKSKPCLDYVLCSGHAKYLLGGRKSSWVRRFEQWDINLQENYKRVKELSENSIEEAVEKTGLKDVRHLKIYLNKCKNTHNHKVISVKFLGEKEDVYDIEVPEYHNFALASGIFVHNSKKDVSDSLAGAIYSAIKNSSNSNIQRYDPNLLILSNNNSEEDEDSSYKDFGFNLNSSNPQIQVLNKSSDAFDLFEDKGEEGSGVSIFF